MDDTNKPLHWLSGQTRLARYLAAALLLHFILLIVLASIKVTKATRQIPISFESAPTSPSPIKESPPVSGDTTYQGPTLGGGGGTPGKGAGGNPNTGGAATQPLPDQVNLAEVISV